MTASTATAARADTAHRLQYERFLVASDVDLMRLRLLEATAADSGAPVSVLDAKLEPGRPAVILYRVGEALVHGTVPVPEAGSGCEPDVVLSPYPVDPSIPGLPCAVSSDCLARSIERGHLDGPVTVERVETGLVRYRPGRRATFEVSAWLAAEGRTRAVRLVAKVYHDPVKAEAVAAEGRELSAQTPPSPLVLARILVHDPEQALVVQEHLPGRPLTVDLETDPPSDSGERLARAGQALAGFHGLTVRDGRARPLERELQRFVTRSAGVASVDEQTGAVLLDLARRLLALPRPDPTVSLVHGDCKPSQFLVDGPRLALLDLDHCGLADPAYDVGNLLASLRQQAVQHSPHRHDTALGLGAAFLDGYRAAGCASRSTEPADRLDERVDVYVAVSLMRKALRAFARDPRSPVPLRLVAEAHRGLDHSRGEPS